MINNNLIISLGMASISMMTNGCIPSSDLAGNSVYEPPPTTEIGTGYINDTYNTEEIKFSVMGDYAVLDGDIMLGLVSELQSTTASSSFVMKNSFFRWPSGIVPYVFDAALPLDNQKVFLAAAEHWKEYTSVEFVNRTTEKNYVVVTHKFKPFLGLGATQDVCMSKVGNRQKGPQELWVGDACGVREIIHEIGHTVGMWHEQSRSDRDLYVNIIWDNIELMEVNNFAKHSVIGQKVGAYDFESIMHYRHNFFDDPSNPAVSTILPIDPSISKYDLGASNVLTSLDIAAADLMYNSVWETNAKFNPPEILTSDTAGSLGRRFIDMDSDGDLDLVYNRIRADGSRDKGAWLNTGTGWERAPVAMDPPLATHKGALGADYGGRYVDVDGDGDLDMLYGYKDGLGRVTKHAFLYVDKDNDGRNDSWVAATEYNPPVLATYYAGDVGRVFVDIGSIDSTGAFTNVLDGRLDIITRRLNTAANTTDIAAWVNTASNVGGAAGSIWQRAPIGFNPPRETAHDGLGYTGYKMVDLDHDGRLDFAFHRRYANGSTVKVAYLNRGAGWYCDAPINASDVSVHDNNCSAEFFERYAPPAQLAAVGLGDRGSRFIDINNDGKLDLVYHLYGGQKGAYLNGGLGIGWQPAPAFEPLVAIAKLGVDDYGRRFVDIDNDGRVDMLYNRLGIVDSDAGAYLNKLTGWVYSGSLTPPDHTSVAGFGDVGKRFVDVNNDGLKDMIYSNFSGLLLKAFPTAYINKLVP